MKKKKYAYLFGFCKSDVDQTGYLAVDGEGKCSVVKDRAHARRFDLRRPKGAEGWAPPAKWLEFFNSEMPDWKFHLVNFYAD